MKILVRKLMNKSHIIKVEITKMSLFNNVWDFNKILLN